MNEILTIIVPVVRPDKAARCVAAIHENAGIDKSFYKVVTKTDDNEIGCPKMVDSMVQDVTTPLVMFLGDDTVPEKDFLKYALAPYFANKNPVSFDVPILIGLNDGTENGMTFATHWLASMALLNLLPDRKFFHTSYKHCFCDYELTDIAKENRCYVFLKDSKIFHDHPMLKGGDGQDKYYERVYADDTYMLDRENFWKRKRKRLTNGNLLDRVAIGEPNIGGYVDREYHISFLMMDKPDSWFFLYPDREITAFAQDWSLVRNNLVIQAMNEGCTCLVMLDTDQEYASDVLMKLLNNPVWKRPEAALVGGLVYKRHKPYTAVVRRGEDPDHYTLPDDGELNSGATIEVDGIGTGCVVINTEVFLDAQTIYPWFKEVVSNKGQRVSEDFNFCYKLRRQGYRIYCDTSTQITHWTRMGVNRFTHEIIENFKKEIGD